MSNHSDDDMYIPPGQGAGGHERDDPIHYRASILHAEASMIIHTQTTHMILVLPGIPTPMPLLEIILENTQGTPTVPLLLVSFILKITQIHLDMQIRICQGVKLWKGNLLIYLRVYTNWLENLKIRQAHNKLGREPLGLLLPPKAVSLDQTLELIVMTIKAVKRENFSLTHTLTPKPNRMVLSTLILSPLWALKIPQHLLLQHFV